MNDILSVKKLNTKCALNISIDTTHSRFSQLNVKIIYTENNENFVYKKLSNIYTNQVIFK